MSLLAEVAARLDGARIRFALIGGEALALHGASRATFDRDLLTTDSRVLDAGFWAEAFRGATEVDIRVGDRDDPLAGVVRVAAKDERDIDLIVGRHAWQGAILDRATAIEMDGASVPLPRAADLVLLKLFAGGPQDLWDIEQLLSGADGDATRVEAASRLDELPEDCRELFARLGRR